MEADSYLTSLVVFYFAAKPLTEFSSQYCLSISSRSVSLGLPFVFSVFASMSEQESVGIEIAQSVRYICFLHTKRAWHFIAMHVKSHYHITTKNLSYSDMNRFLLCSVGFRFSIFSV